MSLTRKQVAVAGVLTTTLALAGCPKTGIYIIDDSVQAGKDGINTAVDKGVISSRQKALITKGCLEEGQADGKRGGITNEAMDYFNAANGTNLTIDTAKKNTILGGKVCRKMAPAVN